MIKRYTIFTLMFTSFLTLNLHSVPEGYKLKFSDEFNDEKLDLTKWAYREDNKHRSIQRRENVELSDGYLRLNLRKLTEPIKGKKASGAGIISRERFKYGYYEVRARLGDNFDDDEDGLADDGWHHAFWAMAAVVEGDIVSTTYPGIRRTEIDCYENASTHSHKKESGLNRFTQHVIIWNEDGKEWGRLPPPPSDITTIKDFNANNWNTYGFEWDENKINFFVNGELAQTAEYPADKFVHDELNVWLTAISANWCNPDAENSRADYDYFRFYEKVPSKE